MTSPSILLASRQGTVYRSRAPLVDTQSARQQLSVTAEVLQTLPTGQTNMADLVALTPGYTSVNLQVGGTTGSYYAQQRNSGLFHGKSGSQLLLDGSRIDNYAGGGQAAGYIFNSQTVQEMVVQTGGVGAESPSPNVLINMVGKEGSNAFRWTFAGLFSNTPMMADNVTPELRERGIFEAAKVRRVYDAGMTVGGPIRRDSIWFFGAFRRWGTSNETAGLYMNANQGGMLFVPDLSRQAYDDQRYASQAVRVTWQASERNKFTFFSDVKKDCICRAGGQGVSVTASTAAEAAISWNFWPNGMVAANWTSPRTDRLLLEAGSSVVLFHWPSYLVPEASPDHISILERSTGFRYNTPVDLNPRRFGDRYNHFVTMSYVTGTHTFKTGFQLNQGYALYDTIGTGLPGLKGVSYEFLNGRPAAIVQRDLPNLRKHWQKAEMGIFAQDQWSIQRLTLNYGARFDYYTGYVPAQDLPASLFLPERHFDAVHKAPEWKDINPRFAASYDVSGDGRTAIKASFGRYVAVSGVNWTNQFNPAVRSINNVNRSWNDANGDFVPDCDLWNFQANGECGRISNLFFGQSNPNATRIADDYRYGWGTREFTWDFATELQRELGRGISGTVGYYHNWDGGFNVTRNEAVDPSEYDPFCITAPVDPRLPGGGGYEVCGLYNVRPDKFGQVSNLLTKADNFGERSRVNDFFAFILDTRFGNDIRLNAGFDVGRTVDDNCIVVNSPQDLLNCRVVTPFSANSQFKANGSIPLPLDFVVSAKYQNLSGASYEADYAASNAEIAPSLGRPLAGGARSVTVPLVAPQTLYEPRRQQLDLRIGKAFRFGENARLQANFDLYNALNAGWIQSQFETYGPRWRYPTLFLQGRLMQISGNLSF